ncbi:hypothetical protein PVK06_028651 [Gossypium arboreum]|uniref:Uncharacterized protein n=1 Tax=Gossypium arboreum TaxID=29729 RepID=A0ABR0P3P2_GOSAR|nr:hypothetical protein PVK06_028651 [Gossypium arboreum]
MIGKVLLKNPFSISGLSYLSLDARRSFLCPSRGTFRKLKLELKFQACDNNMVRPERQVPGAVLSHSSVHGPATSTWERIERRSHCRWRSTRNCSYLIYISLCYVFGSLGEWSPTMKESAKSFS